MTQNNWQSTTKQSANARKYAKRTVNRAIRREPIPMTDDDQFALAPGIKTVKASRTFSLDSMARFY